MWEPLLFIKLLSTIDISQLLNGKVKLLKGNSGSYYVYTMRCNT